MNSVLTSPPNELNVQKLLERVIVGNDLDVTETRFLIKKIMKGEIAQLFNCRNISRVEDERRSDK